VATNKRVAIHGSGKGGRGFTTPVPSTRSGQAWEHALRDEEDYAKHFDYIHYNPVKHGYVESVQDWPYSTFHRWVKQGAYPPDWGSKAHGVVEFDNLDISVIE
jgi:hypothetical protein